MLLLYIDNAYVADRPSTMQARTWSGGGGGGPLMRTRRAAHVEVSVKTRMGVEEVLWDW